MITKIFIPTRDPQQLHRLRRWLMATAASAMVVGLLLAAHLLQVLPFQAFRNAALLVLFFVLVFYGLFRSGLNRKFADPSLTLPQIFSSTLVILYVLYESPISHGILSLIYMVSFLFGVFRLSTTQLLALTGFVASSYAMIIWLQWDSGSAEQNRKILNWIVLVTVLVYFSVMGGYVSRLRKTVEAAKSELERALLRIERIAAIDELTGVFNRRSLVDALHREKSRADRFGTTFSILLLDIDHFKRVNDTLGHQAGDVVLASFARAAAACVRASDTFGRYGGEEFLVILEQTPLDRINIVAERICESARRLNFNELASDLRVTVSAGGTEYFKHEAFEATVARADHALYRAKNGGRNRFEIETVDSGVMAPKT